MIEDKLVERSCTCHPDDRPAECQHRYALTDCALEAANKRIAVLEEALVRLRDDLEGVGYSVFTVFIDAALQGDPTNVAG